MRRRQQEPDLPAGVPVRLVRFRADEWGPGDDLTAAGRWYDARDAWQAAHGLLPFLDDEPMPDAPFDPNDI